MLWHIALNQPQRQLSRGEAAISSVKAKRCNGEAVSLRLDRDLGGCRN